MLESSLVYTLLRSVPEGIVMILSCTILLGIKIDIKNLLKFGILAGLLSSAIRLLPITFGVHTILSLFMHFMLLLEITDKKPTMIAINLCKVFASLLISEVIYFFTVTKLLKIPDSLVLDNTKFESAVITLPSLLILLGIIILLKKVSNLLKKG